MDFSFEHLNPIFSWMSRHEKWRMNVSSVKKSSMNMKNSSLRTHWVLITWRTKSESETKSLKFTINTRYWQADSWNVLQSINSSSWKPSSKQAALFCSCSRGFVYSNSCSEHWTGSWRWSFSTVCPVSLRCHKRGAITMITYRKANSNSSSRNGQQMLTLITATQADMLDCSDWQVPNWNKNKINNRNSLEC